MAVNLTNVLVDKIDFSGIVVTRKETITYKFPLFVFK